jgi:hypothetical protein
MQMRFVFAPITSLLLSQNVPLPAWEAVTVGLLLGQSIFQQGDYNKG